MKTEYEKEWNRAYFHIDIEEEYKETYHLKMIRKNKIPGLLEVKGMGMEGGSRYTYTVSGMQSMKQQHENKMIKKEEIVNFVLALIEVTKQLREYLLNPDCLLLNPDFVFCEGERYYFCYLPVQQKSLSESFHEMTEYFVKNLDYSETDGIFLSYELHKATLQENYDLEKILRDYMEREENRKSEMEEIKEGRSKFSGTNIFTAELEPIIYEPVQDVQTIREMGGWKSPLKKAVGKIKKERWGSWDDLIMETDGQDTGAPL